MSRLDRVAWALAVARVTAQRSTCLRRSVGCVLLDPDGFILATGYNGVATGMPHCNLRATQAVPGQPEHPYACPGAFAASGTQLDGCHAIHAEQNALMRCYDVRRIHTCFTTTSPCMTCTKLLMNTACSRIIFDDAYPHAEAQALWESQGGEWIRYADTREA